MTSRGGSWMRNKEGMGLWEHRGKVAVAGWGQSHIDRRWDGESMDRTMGVYTMQAAERAIADAGLTMDDIDGLITSPDTRVGQDWAPRPFFAPPYDSEDGLTKVSGEWLQNQMGFKNVKYIESNVGGAIWRLMGFAAQAVAEGMCNTALVWYPMGNIPGRYEHNNENASDYANGMRAFSTPWGYQGGAMMNSLFAFKTYCRKYGKSHDGIAPYAINQRRNGLMTPWGFYSLHEPYQLTLEDYFNGRIIMEPLVIYDCDRPVMNCGAYIITTAERAKTMKQPPVYILNHAQTTGGHRSSMYTLEEEEQKTDSLARMMWEGSGHKPEDVDIFNPYDGYLTFTQFYLEAFKWHGVGRGEAHDLYAQGIQVEGPHPFNSSGGNNGTGRTRNAMYFDCIEQLRGQAGPRQVTTRADIAVATFGDATMFGKYPE